MDKIENNSLNKSFNIKIIEENKMNNSSRRLLLLGSSAFFVNSLVGCSTGNSTNLGNEIIEKADQALDNLFSIAPDSYSIYEKSAGTLIMPRITKAGFIFGGSYGEGVLKIGGAPVDFYSVASASYGYQLGALQYSHVIFFMTEEALKTFRVTDGWEIGADAEVFFRKKGGSLGFTNNTLTNPIYAIVFGQRGVIAGASLEGAKYSRLIR